MGVVKICKIRKCKNLHLARGLCIKHYSRFKRHGNPETCLKAKKTILHLKTIKKIKDSYKKKVEIILLTKGKYSIIDKKDFIFLEQYNWIYVKHGYALAKINGAN